MRRRPKDFYLKVILVGDPAVGKTSLVSQYVHKHFKQDYQVTVGVNIYYKKIYLPKGITVTLGINDIGGQERFMKIRHHFFQGTHLAILVYDLTRPETLKSISTSWYPELLKYSSTTKIIPGEPLVIVVGNKADLVDLRMVSNEEGEQLAKEIKALSFFITSAKENLNVDEAFNTLASTYIKYYIVS